MRPIVYLGERVRKGNIMSDPKFGKPARVVVPGLAYFTPEAAKPAKAVPAQQGAEMATLDQMFGYFAE
jgi:hypothetical protein